MTREEPHGARPSETRPNKTCSSIDAGCRGGRAGGAAGRTAVAAGRADPGGRHRQRRHRRRGHRPEGAGGRRLGDRRDHRPSHQIRQDRRHRRPGPLRAARPAEGQIQGVGARLRPRRFGEGRCRARPAAQPERGGRAEREGGGGILSADLLVLDAADPGEERIPRHRPEGQRHQSHAAHPAALAGRREEPRLSRLPCHGHAGHARDPARVRRLRQLARRLDAPHPGRAGDDLDGQRGDAARRRSLHRRMGELDRSRRRRRTAEGQADAAAGRRAQPGADALGLERSETLSARPDRDRPAQADGQCQRQDLRLARELIGPGADPRSGDAHRVVGEASGARSEDAVAPHRSDDAVALLGRRADLGRAGQPPQPDDGREGSPVVHGAAAPGRQSGVLPQGLGSSVGQGVPDQQLDPARVDVRSRRPASSR